MKTKLVYCLVSNDQDIYLEQTLFSMISAKIHNSDVCIVLLVDYETDSTIVGKRKEIMKYTDEYHVLNFDLHFSKKQRSRLLKTSVRQVVRNSLLFIDSDTIICGDLSDLDNMTDDFAAVLDHHITLEENVHFNKLHKELKVIGGNLKRDDLYFNSGVMFSKDTDSNIAFYELWQKNYKDSILKNIDFDQKSLALTNEQMGKVIRKLPDKYNCQLTSSLVPGSKIYHYYASAGEEDNDLFVFRNAKLYEEVKQNGVTDIHINMIRNAENMLPMFTSNVYRVATILRRWSNSKNEFLKFQFKLISFFVLAVNKCNRFFKFF